MSEGTSHGQDRTPEKERWTEALAIEKWKGRDALAYVDKRMMTLASAGDHGGVLRFQQIAACLSQLTQGMRNQ